MYFGNPSRADRDERANDRYIDRATRTFDAGGVRDARRVDPLDHLSAALRERDDDGETKT